MLRRRFLLVGSLLLVALLTLWGSGSVVLAECGSRNQDACTDQGIYAQQVALAEILWWLHQMLLMLSRFLEDARRWFLDIGQGLAPSIADAITPIFWAAVAIATSLAVLAFFARPFLDLQVADLRSGVGYVVFALLLLAVGGPGLVGLEDLRMGLNRWMGEISRTAFGEVAQTIAVEEDEATILRVEPVSPLYPDDAQCPPPSVAVTETRTMPPDVSWDISRKDPDQLFLSDYAATYFFATYVDIWCPQTSEGRPRLPVRFAGTASVEEHAAEYVPSTFRASFDGDGGAYSIVGPPSVSLDTVRSVVCQPRHGGTPPACGFVDQIYPLLVDANIDPAIWLVFAAKETEFGSTGPGRAPPGGVYNLHNIRPNAWDGGGSSLPRWGPNGFSVYTSYMHGVNAWIELMCCRGLYIDAGRVTPAQIISKYAPSFENDTALYIQQVKDWVDGWRARDGGAANFQPREPRPTSPPPGTPTPTPDPSLPTPTPDPFPGYFPFPSIDRLPDEVRAEGLNQASQGISRLVFGVGLTLLGIAEQVMHLLFTTALITTWLTMLLLTPLATFIPTRQVWTETLWHLFAVLKTSWLASLWVALVVFLFEMVATNGLLLVGMSFVGFVALIWGNGSALNLLFAGTLKDGIKAVKAIGTVALNVTMDVATSGVGSKIKDAALNVAKDVRGGKK